MALLKTTRTTKANTQSLAKKATKKPTTSTKVKGGADTIQRMISIADAKLGKYKDKYEIIGTRDRLLEYLESCLESGLAAIDTETTGLDVFTIDIAGICLYTPNEKPCYIPINHCSYVTKIRSSNQLDEETVIECFKPFVDKIKWIMHNADYDIRTLRHTLGLNFRCYWDTMLGAKMLNENSPDNTLKGLHMKHCVTEDKEILSFDALFKGVTFTEVPISTAYLYAAGDGVKTFDLYEYQKSEFEKVGRENLYSVFLDIEMPLVEVVADMEDKGIAIDFPYSKKVSDKYHNKKEEVLIKVNKVIAMYETEIEDYKLRNISHKLSDPINLKSPTQLAVLFYDILGLTSPDKTAPRGTGEEILKEFAKGKEKALCEAILELRGVEKLLSTYIDKMPELATRDGRVHCRFNQLGAKTGRFSSSDPNLQNIPSHNKDIRPMFKASDGNRLIGADYSKQEVFIAASIAEDLAMMESCKQEGDIYSSVASQVYGVPYEECCEFRKDGTTNKEGKERRGNVKAIVLGILYSKEVPSIATDLGITRQKAQAAYDSVLMAFPGLKDFMKLSQDNARNFGYVETAWGRRRHLPDMQLEEIEFSLLDGTPVDFDPLSFDSADEVTLEVPQRTKNEFTKKLMKSYGFKEKNAIIQEAKQRGIKIKDNTGFIAQATRQCVNSRVQGTASDVTKIAMILIHNNQELKDLGYHLLVPIHDELLGECPIENVDRCVELVDKLMIEAGAQKINVPMKVDISLQDNWS